MTRAKSLGGDATGLPAREILEAPHLCVLEAASAALKGVAVCERELKSGYTLGLSRPPGDTKS